MTDNDKKPPRVSKATPRKRRTSVAVPTPTTEDSVKAETRGRKPVGVPKEESDALFASIKGDDLSWIPDDVRGNKEAYRSVLKVYTACKSIYKTVNDIDRMHLVQLGRAMIRVSQFDALAQQAFRRRDTEEYTKCAKACQGALHAVRGLLRDLKLLRVSSGRNIMTTTPTDRSAWKGLL